MSKRRILMTAAAALLATASFAHAADCEVKVGLVMELTGPAGEYGQAGAKSVEMAFRDINDAGGVNGGCKLVTDTRDSQSQGNVAVDAATQLVQVSKVPVIIGGIISSVSIPILTSVTAPAGVVQVSPASSSPTLTQLARDGKTNGVFFRTITSDALQGTAAAKYALDQGLKKLSIIHVNNDFGVNMVAEFRKAYEKLGRHGRLRHALQREPGELSGGSHIRAGGLARRALPRQLSRRRRDHRAAVDIAGRAAKIPAERRHELRRLHQERRRGIPERRLRHLVRHQPDAVDRVFHGQLQGLLEPRSGQPGGRPLL